MGGQASADRALRLSGGYVVEVRQLFFNTPVRRKFLRTTQTEMGHTTEAFIRIALACPGPFHAAAQRRRSTICRRWTAGGNAS